MHYTHTQKVTRGNKTVECKKFIRHIVLVKSIDLLYVSKLNWPNIWNQVRNPSKTGQDSKTSLSTCAFCWTAVVKDKLLEGRIGVRLYFHPNLIVIIIIIGSIKLVL